MKKATKILALLLSLALICGALVVAAFAADGEVAGQSVELDLDFESDTAGALTRADYAALTANVHDTGNVVYDGKSRNGTGYIINENDNQYFKYLADYKGNAGGYLNLAVNPQPTVSMWTEDEYGDVTTTAQGTLDKFDYVMEVDVASPTNLFPTGAAIKAHIHGAGLKADGNEYKSYSQYIPALGVGNDDGGSYLSYNGAKVYVDSSKWAHVTLAITSEIATDDNGEYLKIYTHLWVNGTYVTGGFFKDTSSGMLTADVPFAKDDRVSGLNFCQVRLNTDGRSNIEDTASIAFDNVLVRSYEKGVYEGNLYDVIENKSALRNWDDSIYDRTKMPQGTVIAVNQTTEQTYDDLQYAIDVAESGDTIVLSANVAGTVYVDKEIYVVVAGSTDEDGCYNVEFEGLGDWIVQFDAETKTHYSQQSSESVYIDWLGCTCGLPSCDEETHPGNVGTDLYLGQNILNSYVTQAQKSHTFTVVNPVTEQQIVLVGWQYEDGTTVGADDVITDAMVEESYIALTPVFVVKTPTVEYVNSAGNTILAYDDTSFQTILDNAKAGTTITLVGDIKIPDYTRPAKALTIDLNGFTIDGTTPNSTPKHNGVFWLNSSNYTFTLMSSEPGAKIFAGHANGTATFNGYPVIQSSTNQHVVINGENLAMYTPLVVMSANAWVDIDGGEYYRTATDHWGFLQFNSLDVANITNATFYSPADKPIFGTRGSTEPAATAQQKITVDNCVLLGGFTVGYCYNGLNATITNSYISGFKTVNAGSNKPFAGIGGAWIIGEGNYVADASLIGVDPCLKLADGVTAYDCVVSKDYTLKLNKFTATAENTVDPSSFEIFEQSLPVTFTKYITSGSPIDVEWYDTNGELLATTNAFPGWTAEAPASVPVVDGWLNAAYTDWTAPDGTNNMVIPADAEEYSFTLVEGSDFTYSVGTVPAWINYSVYNHFELSMYVPTDLPEGIEIVSVVHASSKTTEDTNKVYNIDGVNVKRYLRYPGASAVARDSSFEVTYTYEGQTFIWTSPKFSVGNYVEAAFALEDITEDEKALVADMLAYVVTACNVDSLTMADATVAAYDKYKEYCTEVEYTPETFDTSAIADYVDSIAVVFSNGHGGIQYRLAMSKAAVDAGVTLKVTGMAPTPTRDFSNAAFYVLGDVSYEITHNTKIYGFALDTITITAVDADGNELASCNYSFQAYMTEVEGKATEAEWALLEATLAFATSAKKFA